MQINMNRILLSFVLPIYNVELYLQECVDSIVQRMTDECEIILVDDGSKDSSGSICDRYAENDWRIRVIHKENGGLSSARNAGLSAAKGKYVTFVDSDDKIYSESVADVLRWCADEDKDMCFLLTEKIYPDGTKKSMGEGLVKSQICAQSRMSAIDHLTSRRKYPGSAWAKLFRRDFLVENDLHFPNDRRYSEDLGFIRDCMMKANSFDMLEVPFYQYRQNRKGSITNQVGAKNFYDLLTFISESSEKLTVDKRARDPISGYLMRVVAYEYSVLLYTYSALPKEERKGALLALKQYKWVLKYAMHMKVRVIFMMCNLLGLRFTSFLTRQYRKLTEA